MNAEQQIENNLGKLKTILERVEVQVALGEHESAMRALHEGGHFAWLNGCGLLTCVEIENLLVLLSEQLPTLAPATPLSADCVVTVLTSIHAAGGHSRLAWRWIQLDTARRHRLVLTNQESSPIPEQITQLERAGRLEVVRLDARSSLWERAAHLRQCVAGAGAVVLHIHPDDPVAPVALARMEVAPPTLIVDHASHVFWMGLCAANVVVSLHNKAARNAVDRRGASAGQVIWWPIAFDIDHLRGAHKGHVRRELGLTNDELVLLTSGWPYKFLEVDGFSFEEVMLPILQARPHTHLIAVGPQGDDPAWRKLQACFKDRVHLLGIKDEGEMIACYHACDIYVDSMPFSSGSAVMEAAALGKPVAKLTTQEMRDSGFAADLEAVPLSAYSMTDVRAFHQLLLDLIDMSALQRQEFGQVMASAVEAWHQDATCRLFLERAYRQAQRYGRIIPQVDRTRARFEPLDRLLVALGDNYRAWQASLRETQGATLMPAASNASCPPVRALAFYLPQFHEIPENNAWWGQGFTEWTNVRQARPLFEGHEQPLKPTELGYYDLSSVGVMERQAKLAREHGIHGFCFYYYWFDGRRLLEKPVDQLLQAPHINLPFCLCWANENWTRRWDGGAQDVLMPQSYSPDKHEQFARDLLPYFSDPRYICVDGKPVLLVYRTDIIPNLGETVAAWRAVWKAAAGRDVYLIAVESFRSIDPEAYGFDASCEFPPHQMVVRDIPPTQNINLIADPDANVGDYIKLRDNWLSAKRPNYKRFRGLIPGWDNTARRRKGGATLFVGSNPGAYKAWLKEAVRETVWEFKGDERLLFINAWNEWAEGCTLEPTQRWGRSYLEATLDVLSSLNVEQPSFRTKPYWEWLLARRGHFSGTEIAERSEINIGVVVAGDDQYRLQKTRESLAAQLRMPREILNVKEIVRLGDARWTLLLNAGDLLEPDALFQLEKLLQRANNGSALVIYLDHDELGEDGDPVNPLFKPDLSYDSLLSYPYIGRAIVVRNDWARRHLLAEKSLTFDICLAYRLALQATLDGGEQGVIHLPLPLLHLDRSEPAVFCATTESWQALAGVLMAHLAVKQPGAQVLEGPGPGTFHVIHPLLRTPKVSIVIPTRDQLPFLSRCIETLLEKTDYPDFEILVVDNDSQTPESQAFLSGLEGVDPERIRVLRVPGVFNFSRMNNLAVAQARGEFILLLNNDTAVLHADWLSHMMRHALRDGVGIVGARLLYPEGTVQHAGVIMGLRGPAEHPCLGLKADEPGYMFRAQLTQNFSAVTAACMLVSKAVYQKVGGLDEDVFAVSYNDVDFCLRVGKTGRRIVWTPLATLLHEGSASQKADIENIANDKKAKRFTREQAAMYERWPDVIANDPAYNPNLSLVERDYEVETNPLLGYDPLKGLVDHRVVAFAADAFGCGNYRILQPMQAMLEAGLCSGGASPELFGPNLALRSGADTLVFQRPSSDSDLALLESLLPLKNIKKIYEVDDDLSRVPMKSVYREHMPKDIRARLIRNIGLCDRLVVSTDTLAHQLRGSNDDIRVVLNRLPPAMWGDVPPAKQASEPATSKPRVGWAGGISHQGDLELIAQVVRDTADQVDWIFFGMCPEVIRPYVKEFYAGVPTLDYPKRLMELAQSWDLAVAPLEINPFNESKSNLRLLEYGWCCLPVVCSDITPYQGDLPVRRVKNRYKDWRAAILDAVNARDASREMGQLLQQRIHADWMLKGDNLREWYEAWTGD